MSEKNRRRLAWILLAAAVAVDVATGRFGMLAVLAVAAALLAWRSAERARTRLEAIEQQRIADWRQSECLGTLRSMFRLRAPLPSTRGWAASPDFLTELVTLVLNRRPRLVVEASCGVSSVLLGYAMESLSKEAGHQGRVVALEQNAEFADRCREQLRIHGLEDYVEVITAPLVEHDGQWWYDCAGLPEEMAIELLVIDGPARTDAATGNVREPALRRLKSRLAPKVAILLDDGDRPQEREAVESWRREDPDFAVRYLDVEKGAWLLERSSSAR